MEVLMTSYMSTLKSMRFRFRHFVKKHERWFTFIGALIVFLTFVVKEELGDRSRELASAINEGETLYIIRVDHHDIESSLHLMWHSVDAIRQDAETKQKPQKPQKPNQINSRILAHTISTCLQIKRTLSSVSNLVDKLPYGEPEKRQLTDLQHELDQALLEGGELYIDRAPTSLIPEKNPSRTRWSYVPKLAGQDPGDEPPNALSADTNLQREAAYSKSVYNLLRDTLALDADALTKAKALKQHAENRSRVASSMVAGLFALGWGLGLVGKLYGVPSAGSE
jgi:hypothetical protein